MGRAVRHRGMLSMRRPSHTGARLRADQFRPVESPLARRIPATQESSAPGRCRRIAGPKRWNSNFPHSSLRARLVPSGSSSCASGTRVGVGRSGETAPDDRRSRHRCVRSARVREARRHRRPFAGDRRRRALGSVGWLCVIRGERASDDCWRATARSCSSRRLTTSIRRTYAPWCWRSWPWRRRPDPSHSAGRSRRVAARVVPSPPAVQ